MNLKELKNHFAPTGVLRVSINLGNPVLANRSKETDEPVGVSVDLAKEFAKELGVTAEMILFDSAGKSVEAVTQEYADIGFFAIDPLRGKLINFTAPYILITGSYLVPNTSPIQSMDEIDQFNNRVVVGKGSAYDLYLTRVLKNATIIQAATSPTVVDEFVEIEAEVAAGVTQQLEFDLKRFPNHRLLPGHFMNIKQAMGVPKSKGEFAAEYLWFFVERMKESGFVARSLQRHGIKGALIAPLEGSA
ncbi:ABC transporter substrate-binding protein [Nitrincola nitratireducens]|uniref:Bacterial extracellular solute-binding protein, family 3 n=1 Tax=Nitrincola nitratireducens TaxID=1229521 RepID=W9V6S4_9GAMM|nr:ABC transporter substrate-binding protein [Nitrincola nitratireducens]EXJ12601.1 Bacterial extracellular solute-binding protein, family 3 [Nitrincola nitratireducens]